MSIFSTILNKLGFRKKDKPEEKPVAAPAPSAPAKPAAPVAPVNTLEHRTPPRERSRPRGVALGTSPVPIAPIDARRSELNPAEGEMTVPQKHEPRVPALRAEQAGPAPARETATSQPVTVRAQPRLDAEAAKTGYGALLKRHIEKYREYPLMARKSGREGTCSVSCVLGRDGSVRDVRITRSSGHEILDRSALRAVRSVGRFPAVPREIEGDEVSFDVPISFSLSAR